MHGPLSLVALIIICIVTGLIYVIGYGIYNAIRWLSDRR